MTTPICDFVKKYKDSASLRAHMPGHKGASLLGAEPFDITEIDGADVLYNAKGIIKESMQSATKIFGSAKTIYSAEGSSLSIRAMLYLASIYAKSKGQKPVIAAARNVHKSFVTAAANLDLEIEWLYPEKASLISCEITAQTIKNMDFTPTAVYITSPDYLGNILDIKGIAKACKDRGILLLVDNAHGAYLKFLGSHPIDLGADICCDSAHKTLPVLTGGGYLHISKSAPSFLLDYMETAMDIFASTSPSYLILQSLDYANLLIENGLDKQFFGFSQKVEDFKKSIKGMGMTLIGDEPLKISIDTKAFGYTGQVFAKKLIDNGIVPEFYDNDYVVLMLSPMDDCLEDIKKVIEKIQINPPIAPAKLPILKLKRGLSMREAMLSPFEEIDVDRCAGRVMSTPSVTCPPAIPIAVCGEILDEDAIKTFKYYGITSIKVVK